MNQKPGRNDPCHCGSGKKYKQCCMKKDKEPRKLSATWIRSEPSKKVDLMQRAFGDALKETPKAEDNSQEKSE